MHESNDPKGLNIFQMNKLKRNKKLLFLPKAMDQQILETYFVVLYK